MPRAKCLDLVVAIYYFLSFSDVAGREKLTGVVVIITRPIAAAGVRKGVFFHRVINA